MADANLIDLLFQRALLLEALGRVDEAKAAYRDLIERDPTHAGSHNNLARILHREGAREPALALLERLVDLAPDDAMGHANLGIVLFELERFSDARSHLERAILLEPGSTIAHLGMARMLAIEGNEVESLRHQRTALGAAAISVGTPLRENAPRLLLLTSEDQLGATSGEWLSDTSFSIATLIVERFRDDLEMPPHHVMFNAITDADRNASALERARTIAARTTAPIVNHPDAVLATARTSLAQRLGDIGGIVVPATRAFSRGDAVPDVGWPMLLRAPGFHSGQHFVRVDGPQEIAQALALLPGDDLLAIEALPSQSADGLFRKYRMMIVDGELYPMHAAISSDWKVHFFSAEMAQHPERRREDEAFLGSPESVLGPQALRALHAIRARLELDYGGIDFGLDEHGRILVFEANATMTVPAPPSGALWDYRRMHATRILEATRSMLLARARRGGWE
ncbi:MAG TPA: tetratricopeptide repeat protein [Candidatus Acidoferrales bacterium]|nr:tetratricopeptide repeat protein [Candidatus Acidoferrales bacterium]